MPTLLKQFISLVEFGLADGFIRRQANNSGLERNLIACIYEGQLAPEFVSNFDIPFFAIQRSRNEIFPIYTLREGEWALMGGVFETIDDSEKAFGIIAERWGYYREEKTSWARINPAGRRESKCMALCWTPYGEKKASGE